MSLRVAGAGRRHSGGVSNFLLRDHARNWLCVFVDLRQASGLYLMVGMFAGVMCGFTENLNDWLIALTCLGYAAIPFLIMFIVAYYQSKLGQASSQIVEKRGIPKRPGTPCVYIIC